MLFKLDKMSQTIIVLTISFATLIFANPLRCNDNNQNRDSTIIRDSQSPELKEKSLIISHPILDLMKVLGENNIKTIYNDIRFGIEEKVTCDACKLALGLAKYTVFSSAELNFLLSETCYSFRIEDKRVCKGLSNLYTDQLYYILKHTNMTNDQVCGILIGPKCMANPCGKQTNWTIGLSQAISQSFNDDFIIPNEWNDEQTLLRMFEYNIEKDKSNGVIGSVRILHLSDVHIDPYYQFGANSDCDEPLCCRSTSAKSHSQKTSGFWGDYYNCDSPKYTIEQLLIQINKSLSDDYEYLIWTGDIVAHDIWNTTKDTIINGSRSLTSLINKYISNGKSVLPVIGNHEGLPVNQFAPPEITGDLSIGWLYTELLNQWWDWIPPESRDTFKQFGYYSAIVSPDLRIIVMNTNYCARLNFWLLYNPIDPGNQLKWIEKQLSEAEVNKQSVHIIGHIPPDNNQCTPGWVHNYLLIIERYSNIIKGQFFGHTHFDEFRLQFSPSNKSIPIGVAYLSPSVTTYEKVNPSFRLYTIDNTGTVLDHENYYINLTEVNKQHESLVWVPEYSPKAAYNMSSLAPSEWNSIYQKMISNDTLFQSYYNHYHRYSDAFSNQCSGDCKQKILQSIPIYDPISCKSNI